jgi:hypothetical protein
MERRATHVGLRRCCSCCWASDLRILEARVHVRHRRAGDCPPDALRLCSRRRTQDATQDTVVAAGHMPLDAGGNSSAGHLHDACF